MAKILKCAGLCALGAIAGGCASQKGGTVAGQNSGSAAAKISLAKEPFDYAPLKVRNSCFVEAVHFYDEYIAKKRGGEDGWARVLQWGNDDGRISGIGDGHAVAVCRVGQVLWMYDINFGLVPLLAPVDRRNDITDVGPEIFGKYPQFKPVHVSYREDLMPSRPGNVPPYLSNDGNADIREATKVAHALGQCRVVRVVGFLYPDPRTGRLQTGAAALFVFGSRLCLYFPGKGTHLSRLYGGSLDDLLATARIIRRVYPGASDVSWQRGSTWKTPRVARADVDAQRPLTAEPQTPRYIRVQATLWAQ